LLAAICAKDGRHMPATFFEFRAMNRTVRALSWLARKLARREDGSTVIEFGFVVIPFIAIMFAILETALVFFAGQVLETAIADSARLILTGQADAGGYDAAKFRTQVCDRLLALFDCTLLSIDVRIATSFNGADLSAPTVPDPQNPGQLKVDVSGWAYQASGPGDTVVVRAAYEWPTFVRTLGFNLSDLSDGNRLLMATASFRNEPYK
jgi:Flp pilus assembly protein TadG